MQKNCFAVTAKGLEPVLAEELRRLGALEVADRPGGVSFVADPETLFKSCLWLRTASRVLVELRTFSARTPEMLYDQIRRMKWHQYLTPEMTFAVDCVSSGTRGTKDERRERERMMPPDRMNPRFVALRIKDGIADEMRKRFNDQRPSVNVENPDVRVFAYLNDGKCTISLDASGGSLHERGYRKQDSGAPLRETLAAGIILLSGWNGETPFVDLMCGSGTLCIEAALIAANIAPGLLRTRAYGFERWMDFDENMRGLWAKIRNSAVSARKTPKAPIVGLDMDAHAVEAATANAKRAGVQKFTEFRQARLENFHASNMPQGHGTVIVNPPYGERLGEKSQALLNLYKRLGDTYKHEFKGWNGFVFTGNSDAAKSVGLRTSKRIPLFNGPIECRLLRYDLY